MLAKLVSMLASIWRTPTERKSAKAAQQKQLLRKKRAQQVARARNYINPWHNI